MQATAVDVVAGLTPSMLAKCRAGLFGQDIGL